MTMDIVRSVITSIIITFLGIMIKNWWDKYQANKGEIKIYRRFVYVKNVGKSVEFREGQLIIPIWFEILNTKLKSEVVRDLSLKAYSQSQLVAEATQFQENDENKKPLSTPYSFNILGKSIEHIERTYGFSDIMLTTCRGVESPPGEYKIYLSYYDSDDKEVRYFLFSYEISCEKEVNFKPIEREREWVPLVK